jgi:hypothetical protein
MAEYLAILRVGGLGVGGIGGLAKGRLRLRPWASDRIKGVAMAM